MISRVGPEVRLDTDGTIDEIHARGFHLEMMSKSHYWVGLNLNGEYWHLGFHAKKGKIELFAERQEAAHDE